MLKQIFGSSKRATIFFKKVVQKEGCTTFKFHITNVVFDSRDEIKMPKIQDYEKH